MTRLDGTKRGLPFRRACLFGDSSTVENDDLELDDFRSIAAMRAFVEWKWSPGKERKD